MQDIFVMLVFVKAISPNGRNFSVGISFAAGQSKTGPKEGVSEDINFQYDGPVCSGGGEQFRILPFDSAAYRDGFEAFLASTDEKKVVKRYLSDRFSGQAPFRSAADVGAATGELLGDLQRIAEVCTAVEPNVALVEKLQAKHPIVELHVEKLQTAPIAPRSQDLVMLSHVRYYLPREEWSFCTERLWSWVKSGGRYLEILEAGDGDFNRMISEFLGAEHAFDVAPHLREFCAEHNLKLETERRSAWVQNASQEAMINAAVFLINNVPAEVLESSANLPTRKELGEWIHEHYFDGDTYKMELPQMFFVVTE